MKLRNLAVIVGFTMFLAWNSAAFASAAIPSQASATAVGNQTQKLIGLAQQYERAVTGQRQAILDEMTAVALERQQALNQVIEKNPGKVLTAAIPAKVRLELPESVQGYVEQQATLEGTLEVLYRDFDNDFGDSMLMHYHKHH